MIRLERAISLLINSIIDMDIFADRSVDPAVMSAKMSQDAKKDEFRKYLEKAGVLELLTKSLVQLYEVSGSRCEQCNFSLIFAVFRSPRSRVTLCLTSRIRSAALPMTKSASKN